MTLTQMKYIVMLSRCLNFSETARCLYITQPALSRQISIVEAELGTKLFDRNSKMTTLTPAGKLLSEGLIKILNEYEALVEKVMDTGRTYSGKLRIGVAEFRTVQPEIVEAIKVLTEKGVTVDILSQSFAELRESLNFGNLDIIISPDDDTMIESREYEYADICSVQNYLVVPENHPNVYKRDLSIGDFKNDTFLALDARTPSFEQNMRESCALAGFEPKFKSVKTFRDLVVMVASKMGICCLPEDHYLSSSLDVCFLKVPEVKASIIRAFWKKNTQNQAVKMFAELIKQNNGLKVIEG